MQFSTSLLLVTLLAGGERSAAFAPTLSHRRAAFETRLSSTSVSSSHKCSLTMKVGNRGGGGPGGSILSQKNHERVSTAGRRGTKKFVDPGKVFVSGIPYDGTEDDVMDFLRTHIGHTRNVSSLKIIRDWKTGKSKGYGFVIFSDPMFATCAMEFCKNKKIKGRIITMNQGKKKLDPNTLYVKKKKAPAVDEEEAAIQAGMETAEGEVDEEDDKQRPLEDFEDSDDAILFDDEEDYDEDFELDGVFEDIYPAQFEELTEEEKKLNREQRRDAQRRKQRRKLPAKGFMMDVPSPAVVDEEE